MSPLRSSPAARLSPTSLRALALLASISLPGPPGLLIACSSADTGANEASTSIADTAPVSGGDDAGDDDTAKGGTGGDESGNASDSASHGGGSTTDDTADPSAPPDVPDPEPGTADVVESDVPFVPGCNLENTLQLQLRTLDAGAASSPAQVRDAALGNWVSLTGIGIRAWEFFNYYTFDYPAPAFPGAIVVTPGLELDGEEYVLQVGVRTHLLAAEQRPPVRLTLALDNSGSMEGKALELMRATGRSIAASLRAGDTVSIVTWNPTDQVVLDTHPVAGPDDPTLLAKLDKLEAGGSAELYSALVGAYKLAEAAHDPTAWNRVVLVSDGGAYADDADLELIASHTTIDLIGVGVGDPGIYRSDLMDTVAHVGRGASLFVGTEDEANRQFGQHFVRHLGDAVRDVVVRVQLPPGFELVPDSDAGALEDDGILAPDVRLGPGASLVVHRRLRSCAPQQAETGKLTVKVQYVDEATDQAKEVWATETLGSLLAERTAAEAKGAAVRAYARALEQWQTYPADLADELAQAAAHLEQAQKLQPNDPELAEIAAVLAVLGAE